MKRLLPILALAAALSAPGRAPAQEAAAEAGPTPEELAETLGIVDTDEAVLLVEATSALDGLKVGGREIVLAAPTDDGGVWRVVRDQPEGFVSVSIVRGDRLWEGQVRTFAGQVTPVDADELLASGEARDLGGEAVADFDLFAFYDELDARKDDADRLEYCAEVLTGNLTDADRRVVSETCGRIASVVAEVDAPAIDEAEAADLGELLDEDIDPASQRSQEREIRLLYRRDGRPRLVAPGTLPRAIVIGAGAGGGGISTDSAVFGEYQAEQEYVAFRNAERVGDDAEMSRHLFFANRYDGNRNASIAVGTAFLMGTAVTVIMQAVEARQFQRRRQALVGSRDD